MLGFAWLIYRQAQEALRSGRLEEAYRLLSQPAAQGHKGCTELLPQLARAFVARGEQFLRQNDAEAAWNDLLLCEQVGLTDAGAVRLRQALTSQGLAQVRGLLEQGQPARALELIARLQDRMVRQPELATYEEAARAWNQATEQANRGELGQAIQCLERVRRLLPGRTGPLEGYVKELEERYQVFTALLVQLHAALEQRSWNDVVQLSEKVLALAPHHEEARKARSRAWKVVEPTTVVVSPPSPASAAPAMAPQPRFLLWIDNIGGFLVCLGNRVTLGQSTPDAWVDVPILADVSRQHASIVREPEGYLIEAARALQVNGCPTDRALLHSGDRITLGASCQLQFHQPVPVSATARLDLVSGHRFPLAVAGVLLMADTLVLSPGPQAHVVMPDLEQPLVLFRQKEGLGLRYTGPFHVDGKRCQHKASLGPRANVVGDDFALALEPVGTRMGRT